MLDTIQIDRFVADQRDRPTVEQLMDAARAMKPTLQERADRCEQMRRVPDETIAEFAAAGFFRVLRPIEYGGYAYPPIVMLRLVTEIASACPSSAWVMGLIIIHAWELGLMSRQAAEDVWGQDGDARISSSYAPFGAFEKVDGGVKVTGRWPFSSGSDHCNWVFLGGFAPAYTGGKKPGMVAVLVSRDDYSVEDTWNVAGLAGTGSNDIVVDGAFVPDHRIHVIQFGGNRPSDELDYEEDSYRNPFFSVFGAALAAAAIGMAKGALEAFIAQNQSRRNVVTGKSYADDPLVQLRLAKAWALIDAAELKRERDFADMEEKIKTGVPITSADRIRNKWDVVWAAHAADEAIDLVYKMSGGSAARLSNPLQRFYRDISTAANHVYLQFDRGAASFGGFLMTGEVTDPQH